MLNSRVFKVERIFLDNFGANEFAPHAFITGPGCCREVEEVQRNNSVTFAGRDFVSLKSYDQQIEYVYYY